MYRTVGTGTFTLLSVMHLNIDDRYAVTATSLRRRLRLGICTGWRGHYIIKTSTTTDGHPVRLSIEIQENTSHSKIVAT